MESSVKRELVRLILRLGMVAVLVAGCAHNIYHFKKFAEKRQPEQTRYSNNYYYNDNHYYWR